MTLTLHDLETISKQLLIRNVNLFVIVCNLFQMLCTNPEAYVGCILDFCENREFAMEGFMGVFNFASVFIIIILLYVQKIVL